MKRDSLSPHANGVKILMAVLVACLPGCTTADTFFVQFAHSKPLGMKLSPDHLVVGFHREVPGVSMSAEASGWIREGDRLVSVNGDSLAGKPLSAVQQLISRASLPRVLGFDAANGANRTAQMYLDAETAPSTSSRSATSQSTAGPSTGGYGVLELASGGKPLPFSARYFPAEFGGAVMCKKGGQRVVASFHPEGCMAHYDEGSVPGAILVVQRGGCSFADKAILAQSAGVAALVVVNSDEELIRMPWDPSEHTSVKLPVVMIGAAAGTKILSQATRAGARTVQGATVAPIHTSALMGRLVQNAQQCPQWSGGGLLSDITSGTDNEGDSSSDWGNRSAVGGQVLLVRQQAFVRGRAVGLHAASSSMREPLGEMQLHTAADTLHDTPTARQQQRQLAQATPPQAQSHVSKRGAVNDKSPPPPLARLEHLLEEYETGDRDMSWRIIANQAEYRGEYLSSRLGMHTLPNELFHVVAAAPDVHACSPLQVSHLLVALNGTIHAPLAFYVERGLCPFQDKLHNVLSAFAELQRAFPRGLSPHAVVLIANTEAALMVVEGQPDGSGVDTKLFVAMVSNDAGHHMRRLLDATTPSEAIFAALVGHNGYGEQWSELLRLTAPSAWPESAKDRRKLYMQLSRYSHPDAPTGNTERFDYLNRIYQAASPTQAPGQAAGSHDEL